jgi:hypothetical protein
LTIVRTHQKTHLTSYNSTTLSVTLDWTPSAGSVLVAAVSTFNGWYNDSSVSNISQTGVTWSKKVKNQSSDKAFDVEIWTGVIGSGAQPGLTITIYNAPSQGIIADICEYSGLSTNLDVYAINSGVSLSPDTGTTAITTNQKELYIGAIFNYYNSQTTQRNDFDLLDGTYNNNLNSLAYLEKIVTSTTGNVNLGTTSSGEYYTREWFGCIAVFLESGSGSTITVPYNGRYAGYGSKQATVTWSGASNIIQVESNLSNLDSSAVIENLVIDGSEQSNTTGILLENVYNCLIRNVTIKNCDVGIKVSVTGSGWSHANRFEHIRMVNVKTGILFTGTSTNKDFSYTTIDDVGISLKDANDPTNVGIKVGNSNANLYGAFIKATIWLRSSNGTAMEINGQVKFSLVNIVVENSGTGIHVNTTATVSDNQSFLLTALGTTTPLDNDSGTTPDISIET